MKKVAIAGVLGGIVLFVWQFISWTAIPWHESTINTLNNGDALVEMVKEQASSPGVYHYPGMPDSEEDQEAWRSRYEAGPNINFMVFSPTGNSMSSMMFVKGLLLGIFAATLAAWLLSKSTAALGSYLSRVAFVAALGLFVGLTATLSDWNWWNFPVDYTIVNFIDHIVTWTLVGLVVGKFVSSE